MGYSKEKGLTLIEVLIVIAVIGLLAAIAIPNIIRHQSSQKEEVLKPGEIVIDKIPDPANGLWYIVVHNYKEDYVKAKSVDIKTYYQTLVEK